MLKAIKISLTLIFSICLFESPRISFSKWLLCALTLSLNMAPRNKRTVLVKSSDFPAGSSNQDIFSRIVDSFPDDAVDAVQFCPGGLIIVTFESEQRKTGFEESGFMPLGLVLCSVIRTMPSFVLGFGFPFEGSNDMIKDALSPFGDVRNVENQTWLGHSVCTITRKVRIIRKAHIPRFVVIDGIRCKVWYKEQPVTYDTCSSEHTASVCPLHGKCTRCRQEGHLCRDCTFPVWQPLPPPVVLADSVSTDPMPAESIDLCNNELSPLAEPSPNPPMAGISGEFLSVASAGNASVPQSEGKVETGDDLSPHDDNDDNVEPSDVLSPKDDLGDGKTGSDLSHRSKDGGIEIGVNPPPRDNVGRLASTPLLDVVSLHPPSVDPPAVVIEVLDEGFVPSLGSHGGGGDDADASPTSPEISQSVLAVCDVATSTAAPMEVATSESVGIRKWPLAVTVDSGDSYDSADVFSDDLGPGLASKAACGSKKPGTKKKSPVVVSSTRAASKAASGFKKPVDKKGVPKKSTAKMSCPSSAASDNMPAIVSPTPGGKHPLKKSG